MTNRLMYYAILSGMVLYALLAIVWILFPLALYIIYGHTVTHFWWVLNYTVYSFLSYWAARGWRAANPF